MRSRSCAGRARCSTAPTPWAAWSRPRPGDLRLSTEVSRDLAYLRYAGNFDGAGRSVGVNATVSYQRQREVADRLRVPLDRLDRDDNYVDMTGVTAYADAEVGRGGHVTGG